MKYKIEKNTVQETLIIPLYARKVCSELYPNLYRDETAVSLINEIDYDFSEAEKNSRGLMQRWLISVAGWTTPAEVATTAAARSTIWIFRMSSPCAMSSCPPEIVRKTSHAI